MVPAGPAPVGAVTNFENPETLVPVLVSVCTSWSSSQQAEYSPIGETFAGATVRGLDINTGHFDWKV